MIGLTKLLCGRSTVSAALEQKNKNSPELLQFQDIETPLVVWNITRRCNMLCQHCYISALDKAFFKDELTTLDGKKLIAQLAELKVPVLLFSGGEPLVRQDLLRLASWAKEKDLRIVLSTNGTLLTKKMTKRLKEVGFDYVGVSIDGARDVHDTFRKVPGGFDKAMTGVLNSLEAGLKTGIRFTINKLNQDSLFEIIDLAVKEKVPRFCMYHLVYSGRGKGIIKYDLTNPQRRDTMDRLIKKTIELKDENIEILTTDNHADGIYLYKFIKEHQPERSEEVKKLLELHGGCSAGTKMANIGPEGDIHPCQFWEHKKLGNIKEHDFSRIWFDRVGSFICQLRGKKDHLKGKCARCKYNMLCGGCRIRAEVVRGDIWQEDPACYLTEMEITSDENC